MRKVWFHKTVGKFLRNLERSHRKIIVARWKTLAGTETIEDTPGIFKVEGPPNFYKFYIDDADISTLGPTEAYEQFVFITPEIFGVTHIDFLTEAPKLLI